MSEPIITNLDSMILECAKQECERVLAKGITDPVKLYQIAVLSALCSQESVEKIIEEVNGND